MESTASAWIQGGCVLAAALISALIAKRTKVSKNQQITSSPGAVQVGGDSHGAITTNVNSDRRLSQSDERALSNSIVWREAHIEVRSLGSGGEPAQLAAQIGAVINAATNSDWGFGCDLGVAGFEGVEVRYRPGTVHPRELEGILATLNNANLQPRPAPSPTFEPHRITIVVGWRPR